MGFHDLDKVKAEEVTSRYKRKIVLGENITVAKVEVKAGETTRSHRHENEEVIIVLKGAWRFCLPTGEVTLRSNQMLSIPPGVEHSSVVLEDTQALDICTHKRQDWLTGEDKILHHDPDQFLWAV